MVRVHFLHPTFEMLEGVHCKVPLRDFSSDVLAFHLHLSWILPGQQ
jgi:hypothetical protein